MHAYMQSAVQHARKCVHACGGPALSAGMGVQACAAHGQEATLDPRGGAARQQKQKKARLRAA